MANIACSLVRRRSFADIRALRAMGVGCLDFGFGGSTADEVLNGMQKFKAEVLPLV